MRRPLLTVPAHVVRTASTRASLLEYLQIVDTKGGVDGYRQDLQARWVTGRAASEGFPLRDRRGSHPAARRRGDPGAHPSGLDMVDAADRSGRRRFRGR